jgi:hypothetical protein
MVHIVLVLITIIYGRLNVKESTKIIACTSCEIRLCLAIYIQTPLAFDVPRFK